MEYHRTACPGDISKACLQTAYWETQLKEKKEGSERKPHRQMTGLRGKNKGERETS